MYQWLLGALGALFAAVRRAPELPPASPPLQRPPPSPQPPVEHHDGQEQQLQSGTADERDDTISGRGGVPAAVKAPSKEARKRQASISNGAPRAASAGESWALSSEPAVKRPRNSLGKDEIDELSRDGYPLSIGKKMALWESRLGTAGLEVIKVLRLSPSRPGQVVQQGEKKMYRQLLKHLKGKSPIRLADPLQTSTNNAPASSSAPSFTSAPASFTVPASSRAPSLPSAPSHSHVPSFSRLPKFPSEPFKRMCHLDIQKYRGDPFSSGTPKTGIKHAAVCSPQRSQKNQIRYCTPREDTYKNGIPRQQATATKQNGSEASKEGLPNPPLALSKQTPAPKGKKSTSGRKPEPFAVLTKAMEKEIAAALGDGSPDEILSSAFKLKVTRKDIRTLEKLRWLNDIVINFYMALLVDRSNKKKGPSIFAFNTFFYFKLCSGGYSAVKRWSKGVDLFTKDIIFVPVHLKSHWTLGVIDVRRKSIRHYDSLGQNGAKICQMLFKFLQEESLEKRKVDLNCSEWTLHSMEPHEIPQQKNCSDCGVFTCKFADYISRDEPMTFTQGHIPYFRRKMVWEIIHQELL